MKRIATWLAVAGLALLCAPCWAGDSKGYGCYEVTTKPDGSWSTKESSISPEELGKEVGAACAGSSVITVTGSCYSGLYTAAFKKHVGGDGAHLGPSSSTEKTKSFWYKKYKSAWGYMGELAAAFNGSPGGSGKTADDAHKQAKENDPHNPDGKHGEDVEKRKKEHDKWRAKQKNKDKIPTGEKAVPEHPQKETTGNGGKLKLKNGTKSNHALIIIGQPTRGSGYWAGMWEKVFASHGFDTIEVLNNLKGKPVPDGKGGTMPNPGWATKGNITRAIQNLKKLAGPGEHFVLLFLGHTVRSTPSTGTQSGGGGGGGSHGQPGPAALAGGGATFSPTNNTDTIVVSDDFTNDLLEETSIIDSPAVYRMYQPYMYLRTFVEGMSGPVGISINNNFLTSLTMENDPLGGYYTIPLTDTFLEQTFTDIGGSTLNVSFTFAGQNDSFQLATQADILTDPEAGSLYGLGIATVAHGDVVGLDDGVPEPSPWALLLLGVGGFARRRQRR